MGQIRRLVLDVLKPHDPSIVDMAGRLSELAGVEAVNISVYEIDLKVENVKITLEGRNVIYDLVVSVIEGNGGTVHSLDEVVAGSIIIDDADTLQDRP